MYSMHIHTNIHNVYTHKHTQHKNHAQHIEKAHTNIHSHTSMNTHSVHTQIYTAHKEHTHIQNIL